MAKYKRWRVPRYPEEPSEESWYYPSDQKLHVHVPESKYGYRDSTTNEMPEWMQGMPFAVQALLYPAATIEDYPTNTPGWASTLRAYEYYGFLQSPLAAVYVESMFNTAYRAGYIPTSLLDQAPSGYGMYTYAGRQADAQQSAGSWAARAAGATGSTARAYDMTQMYLWNARSAYWGEQEQWAPTAMMWGAARLSSYAAGGNAYLLRAYGFPFVGAASKLSAGAAQAPDIWAASAINAQHTTNVINTSSMFFAGQTPTYQEEFVGGIMNWTIAQTILWDLLAGPKKGFGATMAATAGISMSQAGMGILSDTLTSMAVRNMWGQTPIQPGGEGNVYANLITGAGLTAGGLAYQESIYGLAATARGYQTPLEAWSRMSVGQQMQQQQMGGEIPSTIPRASMGAGGGISLLTGLGMILAYETLVAPPLEKLLEQNTQAGTWQQLAGEIAIEGIGPALMIGLGSKVVGPALPSLAFKLLSATSQAAISQEIATTGVSLATALLPKGVGAALGGISSVAGPIGLAILGLQAGSFVKNMYDIGVTSLLHAYQSTGQGYVVQPIMDKMSEINTMFQPPTLTGPLGQIQAATQGGSEWINQQIASNKMVSAFIDSMTPMLETIQNPFVALTQPFVDYNKWTAFGEAAQGLGAQYGMTPGIANSFLAQGYRDTQQAIGITYGQATYDAFYQNSANAGRLYAMVNYYDEQALNEYLGQYAQPGMFDAVVAEAARWGAKAVASPNPFQTTNEYDRDAAQKARVVGRLVGMGYSEAAAESAYRAGYGNYPDTWTKEQNEAAKDMIYDPTTGMTTTPSVLHHGRGIPWPREVQVASNLWYKQYGETQQRAQNIIGDREQPASTRRAVAEWAQKNIPKRPSYSVWSGPQNMPEGTIPEYSDTYAEYKYGKAYTLWIEQGMNPNLKPEKSDYAAQGGIQGITTTPTTISTSEYGQPEQVSVTPLPIANMPHGLDYRLPLETFGTDLSNMRMSPSPMGMMVEKPARKIEGSTTAQLMPQIHKAVKDAVFWLGESGSLMRCPDDWDFNQRSAIIDALWSQLSLAIYDASRR